MLPQRQVNERKVNKTTDSLSHQIKRDQELIPIPMSQGIETYFQQTDSANSNLFTVENSPHHLPSDFSLTSANGWQSVTYMKGTDAEVKLYLNLQETPPPQTQKELYELAIKCTNKRLLSEGDATVLDDIIIIGECVPPVPLVKQYHENIEALDLQLKETLAAIYKTPPRELSILKRELKNLFASLCKQLAPLSEILDSVDAKWSKQVDQYNKKKNQIIDNYYADMDSMGREYEALGKYNYQDDPNYISEKEKKKSITKSDLDVLELEFRYNESNYLQEKEQIKSSYRPVSEDRRQALIKQYDNKSAAYDELCLAKVKEINVNFSKQKESVIASFKEQQKKSLDHTLTILQVFQSRLLIDVGLAFVYKKNTSEEIILVSPFKPETPENFYELALVIREKESRYYDKAFGIYCQGRMADYVEVKHFMYSLLDAAAKAGYQPAKEWLVDDKDAPISLQAVSAGGVNIYFPWPLTTAYDYRLLFKELLKGVGQSELVGAHNIPPNFIHWVEKQYRDLVQERASFTPSPTESIQPADTDVSPILDVTSTQRYARESKIFGKSTVESVSANSMDSSNKSGYSMG